MQIDKRDLADKLKQLKGIIPSGNMMENLKGVLISDGMITANNLNYGMQLPFGAIDSAEKFFLSQKAIDLILRLPNGALKIDVHDDFSVEIQSESIHNKFPGINPANFPAMPYIDKTQKVWVDAEELLESIQSVIYATGKEDDRPIMASIYLLAEENILNIVSTDGYQLAWSTIECFDNFELIIPAAAAMNLIKCELSGKMYIYSNKTSALFETNECSFFTRLVASSYPNFKQLFKNNQQTNLVFNKSEAIEALERASIVANDKIVRLIMNSQTMYIEAKSQFGEYQESLKLSVGPESEIKFSCNVRFMLDALKARQEDIIKGFVHGPLSPMIFENEKLKNMFLPIREK